MFCLTVSLEMGARQLKKILKKNPANFSTQLICCTGCVESARPVCLPRGAIVAESLELCPALLATCSINI